MKTQIYGIISLEQAVACVDAGADHLGLVVNASIKNDHISMELAKEIAAAVRGHTLISVIFDLAPITEDELIEQAKELKPDIIHLCGYLSINKKLYDRIHSELPGTEVMQAIGVTDPESVEYAKEIADYCDLYILDSVKPGADGVGAAGVTHDWNLDRQIVEAVGDRVKVIGAGGLDETNVAAAIEAVHPYGVDTLSKTSIVKDGVYIGKDMKKVKAFCEIAHKY